MEDYDYDHGVNIYSQQRKDDMSTKWMITSNIQLRLGRILLPQTLTRMNPILMFKRNSYPSMMQE
jgi:hypothetical protein